MVLRVPPSRVWHALTRPEELLAWRGDPSVYQCTRWVFDPIAGRRWRAERTNAAGGTFSVGDTVLEAVPWSLRGGLPNVPGWLRRYLGPDESPRVTARSIPGPEEPAR